MTTERDFDRLARAWLELSPDEAPYRTIEAVLQAIETTPQVRPAARWLPWRFPVMTRPLFIIAAATAIVIAIGGALLLGRGPTSNIGGPSPSIPSSIPSASAAAAAVPAALLYHWIGAPRDVPPLGTSRRTALKLTSTSLSVTGTSYDLANGILRSDASVPSPGQITLVLRAAETGCKKGDTGRYSWSVSPIGSVLTVVAVGADSCSARASAVSGTWYRDACKRTDDGCLGDIDAGSYPSQYLAPRLAAGEVWQPDLGTMQYTVPDGWANSSDWPATFGLTPSSDYALVPSGGQEGSRSILLAAQPVAASQKTPCSDVPQAGVARTVEGEITWLRHLPGLIATTPSAITIDGHQGQFVDVGLDPASKADCPGGLSPEIGYMTPQMGIAGTDRQRVILVDLGNGDLIGIVVSSPPAQFDAFVAQATPIIQSFKFR